MIKEQHEKLKTPAPQKPSLLTQITKTKVEEAKKFCIKNRLKEANIGWTGKSIEQTS